MKIQSYLPVFPGFYGTIFEYENEEYDLDDIRETTGKNLKWEDVEWDYAEYHNRVAEECADAIERELKTDGFDIEILFEKLHSPREYNFSNDVVYVEYELSEDTLEDLKEYAQEHYEEWEEYLKENFTSRSGFFSFFEPNPERWFTHYLDPEYRRFSTSFASLLEFYLQNEGFDYHRLYDAVSDQCHIIEYKLPGE